MSWVPNKKKLFLAALLVVSGAGTAAADVLVVRASGPSAKNFPAGKAIADNARITLKANDSLVVLDSRGTRTLRGPGTFSPSGPAQANTRSAIASVATGTTRRARIGAVRSVGANATVRPANLWQIDVAKSSNICIVDPASLTLWRADAAKPVELTLTGSDGRNKKVNWAAGQATLAWPTDLAMADGAGYRLSWPGAAKPTELKFRTLPAKPGGLEEMASSLIQNGCEAQLDVLIETVKLPDDMSAPAG